MLEAFVAGHHAGRNLYIWGGDDSEAAEAIRRLPYAALDVTALAPDPTECPRPDAEARALLVRRLEEALNNMASSSQPFAAILIRGAPLLARYGVGLRPFYPFVGDRRLILIAIPRPPFPNELNNPPRGLTFDPGRVSAMLEDIAGKDHVVEVTER